MNKKSQINLEDLSPEAREQLGLSEPEEHGKRPRRVSPKLTVLGQILVDLKGMTTRDALWCLTQAGNIVRSQRDATISAEARRKPRKGGSDNG